MYLFNAYPGNPNSSKGRESRIQVVEHIYLSNGATARNIFSQNERFKMNTKNAFRRMKTLNNMSNGIRFCLCSNKMGQAGN